MIPVLYRERAVLERESRIATVRLIPRNRPGLYSHPGGGFPHRTGEHTLSEDRSVEEMTHEVLMRQAKARAEMTGEPIEEAMEAVLNTEAGAQLRELRDVPHDEESLEEWRVSMSRERAEERTEDLGDHLEEPPERPRHG
jgi:hypothetical protein